MIKEGYEWQVRALADEAHDFSNEINHLPPRSHGAAYAEGVADALRLIAGDINPENNATLDAIYRRYLTSLDPEDDR